MSKKVGSIDFNKAPKDMFIVIGHIGLDRSMLHQELPSQNDAEKFTEDILSGTIKFKSCFAKNGKDFNGINVIDDQGDTVFSIGEAYGFIS